MLQQINNPIPISNFLLKPPLPNEIRLLDLCCKAGGAAVGYALAANALNIPISITGIDIEPQPNYPFHFIQSDALSFLNDHHSHFTHIHASPPCQHYSPSTAKHKKTGKQYDNSLQLFIHHIQFTNISAVIENVMAAPMPPDIILRGDMFNLPTLRKRKFHTINWFSFCPPMPKKQGSVKNGDFVQVIGNGQKTPGKCQELKIKGSITQIWSSALDIFWMTKKELSQAVPPAYTQYIGQLWFQQTVINKYKQNKERSQAI